MSSRSAQRWTLPELLDRRAQERPDQPFLYVDDVPLTYGVLQRRSVSAANRLRALGIGRGDAVAVLMENCPEYLDVLFGVTRLGGLYVPVNTAFRGDFLAHQLRDAGAKVVVVDEALLPRVAEVASQLPDLRAVLVRGAVAPVPGGEVPGVEVLPVQTLLDARDDALEPAEQIAWDDLCALFYTSGTTGPSKGAALTQHYLLSAGKAVADAWDLQPHETV